MSELVAIQYATWGHEAGRGREETRGRGKATMNDNMRYIYIYYHIIYVHAWIADAALTATATKRCWLVARNYG